MKVIYQLMLLVAVVGLIESTPLERLEKYFTRSTDAVKFFLYTKSNPSSPQQLITDDISSVTKSHFNADYPTRIIIHGWTMSGEKIPNPQLRSAYLSVGDYNIISVDWEAYASLNYLSSSKKVSVVGGDVAEFIDFLNKSAGLSFESLVVIGHSLGAHCAGFAGKYVTRGRLPYIVGLDPALPLFSYSKPDGRLNSNDADYVETIQTNGGLKGFLEPIGSASFYPNWGRKQPGCGLDVDGACSHARCVFYYAEAIKGYKFTPVKKCSDYTDIKDKIGCETTISKLDIGDPAKIHKENGIFYLETNSEEPFGHK